MRALQAIAMGYVVIALFARQGGYDLLPDPLGWVLVLLGVSRLPVAVPRRPLLYAGSLALAVSVPLWVPAVLDAIAREDDALAWAADLPALLFSGLLAHHLARAAQDAGDRSAALVLQGLVALVVVVVVLPVFVFGAGLEPVADLAGASGQLLNLALVVVLFTFAARPWAHETTTAAAP